MLSGTYNLDSQDLDERRTTVNMNRLILKIWMWEWPRWPVLWSNFVDGRWMSLALVFHACAGGSEEIEQCDQSGFLTARAAWEQLLVTDDYGGDVDAWSGERR